MDMLKKYCITSRDTSRSCDLSVHLPCNPCSSRLLSSSYYHSLHIIALVVCFFNKKITHLITQ